MKAALFVGRFQPFHIAHLKDIKWILKKYDKVVIVVGSSQKSNTEKNPFTFKERKRMIENTLKNEGIKKFEIIGIPDVYNDKEWAKSIIDKADFDIVFSRNPWTKRCFESFEIPVKKHPKFGDVSGTRIRKLMEKGMKWNNLVPKEVEKILKTRN